MKIKITPKTPQPIEVRVKKIVITHYPGSQSDNYCVEFFDGKNKSVKEESFDHLQDVAEMILTL